MPTWWEQFLHVATGRVSRHADLPDLRGLPTRPVALERTHYVVNDSERHGRERRTYVLRRESPTRRDPVSVCAYSNGRGVGYLPADVAASVAPMLDRLGGAATVNGAGSRRGSIRLWVDLPSDEALRDYVSTAA